MCTFDPQSATCGRDGGRGRGRATDSIAAPKRTRFLFYVIVRIAFPDFQRSRIILSFKYTTVHLHK